MKISTKNFAVVIVLYAVKLEQSLTFISLSKSIQELGLKDINLIVYDNSPNRQEIDLRSNPLWKIQYIHDETNPGVSKAYNVSVNFAKANSCEWVLLTDQDTDFPPLSMHAYFDAANSNNNLDLFVPMLKSVDKIYSPCKVVFSRGKFWPDVKIGKHKLKGLSVLNSGIMISTNAFTAIGGYNENIELYFSDFDFIDRYKIKYPEFFIIDLICNHQLSDIVSSDIDAAKRRFHYYCKGSYLSKKSNLHHFQLFSAVFLRSVKLSIEYKNFNFVKIFAKFYL